MPDPFARLIPEARAFLRELSANNNRDWFTAHKTRYDAQLKTPATHLLDQVAPQIGATKSKLFRPHRDVRFSKDKTPYHTHLHMLWDLPGCGFFFGIAPDYVSVGGGVMGFDKDRLTAWRQAVDMDATLADLIESFTAKGLRVSEPELKRVPAPFDKDHPRADLLRRKSLTVWRDLPESEYPDPLAALTETYQTLRPLLDRLQDLP